MFNALKTAEKVDFVFFIKVQAAMSIPQNVTHFPEKSMKNIFLIKKIQKKVVSVTNCNWKYRYYYAFITTFS
jgi:hypothetical protein